MSRRSKTAGAGTGPAAIPPKLHFKIGEVSHITGVKPHVLRYWESEFPALRPEKSPTNQRLYRRRDVETLLLIKRLLYQEGFTITGAKKRLAELAREARTAPAHLHPVLQRLRGEVEEILALVEDE